MHTNEWALASGQALTANLRAYPHERVVWAFHLVDAPGPATSITGVTLVPLVDIHAGGNWCVVGLQPRDYEFPAEIRVGSFMRFPTLTGHASQWFRVYTIHRTAGSRAVFLEDRPAGITPATSLRIATEPDLEEGGSVPIDDPSVTRISGYQYAAPAERSPRAAVLADLAIAAAPDAEDWHVEDVLALDGRGMQGLSRPASWLRVRALNTAAAVQIAAPGPVTGIVG